MGVRRSDVLKELNPRKPALFSCFRFKRQLDNGFLIIITEVWSQRVWFVFERCVLSVFASPKRWGCVVWGGKSNPRVHWLCLNITCRGSQAMLPCTQVAVSANFESRSFYLRAIDALGWLILGEQLAQPILKSKNSTLSKFTGTKSLFTCLFSAIPLEQ